jgi:hypothetical protein
MDGYNHFQISLRKRAVPAMIFSLAYPNIPNFSRKSKVSRLTVENRLNYSSFGYSGGGFDKKSTYRTGNFSDYSSFCERGPSKFLWREHPWSISPFSFTAFSLDFADSKVVTRVNLSKAILFLLAACLHALMKTTGWNNYAKSHYSSFMRPDWAFKTHCFTSSNFLPNLRIQSEGSSHYDQNYSHSFGKVRPSNLFETIWISVVINPFPWRMLSRDSSWRLMRSASSKACEASR